MREGRDSALPFAFVLSYNVASGIERAGRE